MVYSCLHFIFQFSINLFFTYHPSFFLFLFLFFGSERWVLHSTMEYAQRILAQTGLQKLSDGTLTKVAEELFQELQSMGLDISQPFFKKAHRWLVYLF